MTEDRAVTFDPAEEITNGAMPAAELAALRTLLVGPEQQRLDELAEEFHAKRLTAAELAEQLPEAIALSGSRGQQLGRALAPAIQTAIHESIRRSPAALAAAIFPILGPAIRKAIAETMAGLVRSINTAVEHSLSLEGLQWRIEAWRTGVPYPEVVIKHALVYRVEQVFLVHAETGLLLAHVTAANLQVQDAGLVSAMLTAIQDFVRDSFRPGEGGMLRTFSVGEHTVQVEAGPHALLAVVVRGQAPDSLLPRQQDVLETVHLQFASQLTAFAGDAAPFDAARPLLDGLLETVLATRRPRAGGAVWLRWALPLVLILGAVVAFSVRASVRWQRALTLLAAEPGVVVVNASRGLGGWHISGMKDPMAREPGAVLAAAGLASGSITGRWERYLSLDSAMVVARARQSLALPPDATLALRGDTLAATSAISLASIVRARQVGLPAGIGYLDLSAAHLTLPIALDSLRQAVEAERVLFDPGSADLSMGAAARVTAAAALLRRLDAGAAALGGSIHLVLVGRTDPTGTDETNHALAQWRVDRVAGRLASTGLDTSRFIPQAVATARPLPSSDPLERAAINRSVSFSVVVSARAIGAGKP